MLRLFCYTKTNVFAGRIGVNVRPQLYISVLSTCLLLLRNKDTSCLRFKWRLKLRHYEKHLLDETNAKIKAAKALSGY